MPVAAPRSPGNGPRAGARDPPLHLAHLARAAASKIGLRNRGAGSPSTPASTGDAATVGPRAARPSSSPWFGEQPHILAPAAQSHGLPYTTNRQMADGAVDGRRGARRAEPAAAARGRREPADDAAARYKSIYGKHDHTRGTVGMEAYAEAGVGHGATWWGAASGPSSARSAAISLRISATMARTASSSCDVRSVLRVAP